MKRLVEIAFEIAEIEAEIPRTKAGPDRERLFRALRSVRAEHERMLRNGEKIKG